MQNVQRKLNGIGKDLTRIGSQMTLGITAPLAGLGALALDAAADFETLEARLETALGSSSLAKQTFEELKSFTKDLAITTEEAADSYIKLKNLGLDPTIDALKSYGNTAAAQGKSINQLIEAVADASTGEFERLKEFGIKANQEGEKVTLTFQGMSTTIGNNAREIQKYLQDLGNTTFAGALEKQANTFNGLIAIIKDNIRSTIAEFGKFELDALKPIAEGLNDLFDRIRALSPETKKFLVIFGGIAAAVGPLLALAGTILPAIGTGFALLTGPIGLIAAGLTAIGVIIYKNWAPIKRELVNLANYFIDLYNEAIVFRVVVEGIRTSFNNVFDTGKFVFSTLGNIITTLGKNIKDVFVNAGDIIKAVFTRDFDALPKLLAKNFADTTENFKELIRTATQDFEALKGTISDNIQEGIERAMNNRYELIDPDAEPVKEAVSDATNEGFKEGINKGIKGVASQKDLFKGLGTSFRDEFAGAFGARVLNQEEIDRQFGDFEASFDKGLSSMEKFKEEGYLILEDAAENFAAGFGNLIGQIALGTAGLDTIGAFLLNTIGTIAENLGKAAIQIGITAKAIKDSFALPGLSIAAGIALVALGGLIKNAAKSFAGNFADGGIIPGTSFSGDRLVAGVNSGELILNIAQQKNLAAAIRANSAPVILQPSISFSGREMKVFLERIDAQNKRST